MPWQDPQFWIVSAGAALALRILVRTFVPSSSDGTACGSCATGAAACSRPRAADERRSPLVILKRSDPGS